MGKRRSMRPWRLRAIWRYAVLPDDLGWCNAAGNVMGVYLHGMLEDAAVLQALFGTRLQGNVPTLDKVFDGLADYIGIHFGPGVLDGLVGPLSKIRYWGQTGALAQGDSQRRRRCYHRPLQVPLATAWGESGRRCESVACPTL